MLTVRYLFFWELCNLSIPSLQISLQPRRLIGILSTNDLGIPRAGSWAMYGVSSSRHSQTSVDVVYWPRGSLYCTFILAQYIPAPVPWLSIIHSSRFMILTVKFMLMYTSESYGLRKRLMFIFPDTPTFLICPNSCSSGVFSTLNWVILTSPLIKRCQDQCCCWWHASLCTLPSLLIVVNSRWFHIWSPNHHCV